MRYELVSHTVFFNIETFDWKVVPDYSVRFAWQSAREDMMEG
jgi:hypothetical protein